MMNSSSTRLMDGLYKKARNMLALLLAMATWQASIPIVILLTSSAFVTAQVAHAIESTPVKLVQGFGWDYSNGGYKALIQSNNGNQYFVWYSNLIEAKVGSVVTLTYEGSYPSLYFYKLINSGNGKEASITRYERAN